MQTRLATEKPLILHVHSLESDRSGIHGNQHIYNIERRGMQAADHIIAVSHHTRKKIVRDYGISERKVSVVHNAVSHSKSLTDYNAIKEIHSEQKGQNSPNCLTHGGDFK
ncbi:MAG: glycosyltransferase family 4 protein [Syntrophales bacterium]|nr:glycosyltransferase family 4 protein [Syntrophales bacterium]